MFQTSAHCILFSIMSSFLSWNNKLRVGFREGDTSNSQYAQGRWFINRAAYLSLICPGRCIYWQILWGSDSKLIKFHLNWLWRGESSSFEGIICIQIIVNNKLLWSLVVKNSILLIYRLGEVLSKTKKRVQMWKEMHDSFCNPLMFVNFVE